MKKHKTRYVITIRLNDGVYETRIVEFEHKRPTSDDVIQLCQGMNAVLIMMKRLEK